jgi:quercetin dioxygenase-like cupin family protein
MIISEEKFEKIYQQEGATGLKIINNNGIEIVKLCLKPFAIINKHSLPYDVYFYVLSGQGNLNVSDNEFSVDSNSLVFCRANEERMWQNTYKSDLHILVIKKLL